MRKMGAVVYQYKSVIAACCVVGFLASCETAPTTEEDQPAVAAPVVEEAQPTATPGLTPQERLRTSISLLESGDAAQSRLELLAYLEEEPDSAFAKRLLDQIDEPIETYFPADSFARTLQTGETLSTLARDYLGDPLKFYALARFNGIEVPNKVTVGQTVQIPATEAALAAQEAMLAPPAPPAAEEVAAPAGESVPAEAAAAEAVDGAQEFAALVGDGDYASAVDLYEAGSASGASEALAAEAYDKYAASLRTSAPSQAAAHYAKAGDLYMQTSDYINAYRVLGIAGGLAPANTGISESLVMARQGAVDELYRQGASAFQRQELETTIERMNAVLDIDPGHENAKMYRAQAVELQERLKRLSD